MQSWETSLDSLRNQAITLKTPVNERNGDFATIEEPWHVGIVPIGVEAPWNLRDMDAQPHIPEAPR
jgi:hypothetical protein